MLPPLLIFGLVAIAIVYGVMYAYKQAEKRRRMLSLWAYRQGLRYRPDRDDALERRFPLHECLQQGSNRYGENVMEGRRKNRDICAFDYHYETHSTDSRGRRTTHHHAFSAVVVDSQLPLHPLSLRPESVFDRISAFVGFDDIDFESGAFSRAFYVKAPDKRWAFDVFHQATMEFLLEMPRYTVEVAGPWIMVWKAGHLAPREFGGALAVAEGILDRLPGYLLRELKGADA